MEISSSSPPKETVDEPMEITTTSPPKEADDNKVILKYKIEWIFF